MSLTLVILANGLEDGRPALAITLDSPRIVLGRRDGSDVRLPDLSVSARHASIRQRGSEYLLVDEGSTNGTALGSVALGPQAPVVLRSGDRFRLGRVWLEVRVSPEPAAPSLTLAADALALELVARGLAAQAEPCRPKVTVLEGPDAGLEWQLEDPYARRALGRGKECELVLTDAGVSRRHLEIAQRGREVTVRDLGGGEPATLDGAAVSRAELPWRPGKRLTVGATTLSLAHPALEALLELERGEDERVAAADLPPPPEEPAPPETPAPPEVAPTPTTAPVAAPERPIADSRGGGWNLTDGAVLLVALGVLAISVAGLYWIFQ
jgi:pSer/pThr/pTyr-binding forkhead associated (FHA) protein